MKLIGEALTFDDVSLVPSYSDVLPKDVALKTETRHFPFAYGL